MALRIGALILASCQLFNATVINVGDLKFFQGLSYSGNQPYVSVGNDYDHHDSGSSYATASASSSSGSQSSSASASSSGKGGSSASASASSGSSGGSSSSASSSSGSKGSSASSSASASNGKSSAVSTSSAGSNHGGYQGGKSWSNHDDEEKSEDHDQHGKEEDDSSHDSKGDRKDGKSHSENDGHQGHKSISQVQVVVAKPVVVSQYVIGDSDNDDAKKHYNTNKVNVNKVPVNFAELKYVPQSNAPVKAPISVINVPIVSTAPTVQHVVAPNYNINHSNIPQKTHKDKLANELLFNYKNLSSTDIHKVVKNKVPDPKEVKPAPHIKPVTPGHLEKKAQAQIAVGKQQQNAPIVIHSFVTVDNDDKHDERKEGHSSNDEHDRKEEHSSNDKESKNWGHKDEDKNNKGTGKSEHNESDSRQDDSKGKGSYTIYSSSYSSSYKGSDKGGYTVGSYGKH